MWRAHNRPVCAGAGARENALVGRRPGWDYRLMNATGTRGAMDVGRARDSLNGLALGDAFGETWFRISAGEAERRSLTRDVPAGPWPWTDDTAMALSLYQVLTTRGEVRQDGPARAFADACPPRGGRRGHRRCGGRRAGSSRR